MIVNRYIDNRPLWRRFLGMACPSLIKQYRLKRSYIKQFKALNKNAGFPQLIQIETINRCNGDCSFCPVNRKADTRTFAKMDEKLFDKLLDELSQMNYSGQVALFSNNEPLLDTRICEWAKKARNKLPKAYLYIYTNGSLIDLAKTRELIKYLDKVIIDNYNDSLCVNSNIQPIVECCDNEEEMNRKVEIHIRKQNEILTTRGGQAPNAKKVPRREMPCCLPFSEMIIRPDGMVSLCCNDALGKMTLGDLNKNSIYEVWNSEQYNQIRQHSLNNDLGSTIELCAFCDSIIVDRTR